MKGISFDDMDEDYDDGDNCQSLTHGQVPVIKKFNTPEEELEFIAGEIKGLEAAGVLQKDICLVARTHKLIDSYKDGLRKNGFEIFEIKVSLEEFETEEKCLLYVALTRARAGAYVTCYGTMSNLIV